MISRRDASQPGSLIVAAAARLATSVRSSTFSGFRVKEHGGSTGPARARTEREREATDPAELLVRDIAVACHTRLPICLVRRPSFDTNERRKHREVAWREARSRGSKQPLSQRRRLHLEQNPGPRQRGGIGSGYDGYEWLRVATILATAHRQPRMARKGHSAAVQSIWTCLDTRIQESGGRPSLWQRQFRQTATGI